MTERLVFVDGPLKGTILEDVRQSQKRYPDRITFEFAAWNDQQSAQDWGPNEVYAKGAESLIAEYEFDCGLGYFQFAGWTIKRLPEKRREDQA